MLQPPSPWLTAKELLAPIRIAKSMIYLQRTAERKRSLPPLPTVVIPGLGSSDLSTTFLRRRLTRQGLRVYAGGIGRNDGNVKALLTKAGDHLESIFEAQHTAVILIGWSLGGIIARELARRNPKKVRAVCTMGSPIVGGGKYSAYAPIYKKMGYDLDKMERLCNQREVQPIPVPTLSVYSKRDGVVAWRASIDSFNEETEHAEVNCGHFTMGFSTEVFDVIVNWLTRQLPEE